MTGLQALTRILTGFLTIFSFAFTIKMLTKSDKSIYSLKRQRPGLGLLPLENLREQIANQPLCYIQAMKSALAYSVNPTGVINFLFFTTTFKTIEKL